MTPLMFSAEMYSFCFSFYSRALIFDGNSIILNILVAAAVALAMSGPRDIAVPDWEAPNRIAKIVIIMSAGLTENVPVVSSKLFSMRMPPKKKQPANMT